MQIGISPFLDFTAFLAQEGGKKTLPFFNHSISVDRKLDDSPVTEADLVTEKWIRTQIENRFPDHNIVGEEFGHKKTDSSYTWIIDPIDGTKSFIHGIPLYTTLVALLDGDEALTGAIYAPATDELCVAERGKGCFLNGEKTRVRNTNRLAEASLMTTDVRFIAQCGYQKPYDRLAQSVRLERTWGDAYGYLMLAAGRADIMFDPELNIWDAAPLKIIIEEAGGAYFNINGGSSIQIPNAIASTNELKTAILDLFQP